MRLLFTFADHLVKPFIQTYMSNLTDPEKKILQAAKQVFEAYGYTGARMQQIADTAGISKASLHYYFRSKEKLFDRIFEETMAEFIPLVSTWEESDNNWEVKLSGFITAFFTFLRRKSMLFIIQEVNRDPGLLAARKKDGKTKKNRFIAYFERLQLEGKIKHIDTRTLYIFLHSLCAYPILNSVIFKMNLQLSDKEYEHYMQDYPTMVAEFLIENIKNKNKSK